MYCNCFTFLLLIIIILQLNVIVSFSNNNHCNKKYDNKIILEEDSKIILQDSKILDIYTANRYQREQDNKNYQKYTYNQKEQTKKRKNKRKEEKANQRSKEKYNYKEEKLWINPLFELMNHIVSTVYFLVMEYFIVFKYCFCYTLNIFVILIYGYYHLLELLFEKILDYPTIIYSIMGMFLALYQCNNIIKNILNSIDKNLQNSEIIKNDKNKT